jgi:hypothetical protein
MSDKLSFDFSIASKLYEEGERKDYLDCKEYISKHIFQIKNTNSHIVFEDNKPIQLSREAFVASYLDKFEKDIVKWHKKRIDMVKLVCKTKQPVLQNGEVNMFGGFMHEKKPYEQYSKAIKDSVNVMLDFLKDVICSNHDDQFDYLKKWLANMVQGNKNDSVLYLKGEEGIGKSTFTDFIIEWVLGWAIVGKGTVECLTTPNNMLMRGMLLVVFEELPTFSDNEWEAVSSKLKDLVTSQICVYANKYIAPSACENISNFIINTNVNAIKHSEGRRYFILDLSNKRKSDFQFFSKLKGKCFNKEVGEAFYNYLLGIDLSGFYAQEFPYTKAKALAKVISLSMPHQFLKEDYVLQRKGIEKMKRKSFYEKYTSYLSVNHLKVGKTEKANFYGKLESIGIVARKSNGDEIYDALSAEKILAIAEKNQWIHESDDFEVQADPKKEIKLNQEIIEELQEKIKSLETDIKREKQTKIIVEAEMEKTTEVVTTEMLEKATPYKEREIPNVFAGSRQKVGNKYEQISKDLFSSYENMTELSMSLI